MPAFVEEPFGYALYCHQRGTILTSVLFPDRRSALAYKEQHQLQRGTLRCAQDFVVEMWRLRPRGR